MARLFCGFCRHVHADEFAAKLAVVEHDAAVDEREQGVILADADVAARIEFGPALADEDVAADHGFAAELLHAEALACGITAVTRRTACLLMCHGKYSCAVRFSRSTRS